MTRILGVLLLVLGVLVGAVGTLPSGVAGRLNGVGGAGHLTSDVVLGVGVVLFLLGLFTLLRGRSPGPPRPDSASRTARGVDGGTPSDTRSDAVPSPEGDGPQALGPELPASQDTFPTSPRTPIQEAASASTPAVPAGPVPAGAAVEPSVGEPSVVTPPAAEHTTAPTGEVGAEALEPVQPLEALSTPPLPKDEPAVAPPPQPEDNQPN